MDAREAWERWVGADGDGAMSFGEDALRWLLAEARWVAGEWRRECYAPPQRTYAFPWEKTDA